MAVMPRARAVAFSCLGKSSAAQGLPRDDLSPDIQAWLGAASWGASASKSHASSLLSFRWPWGGARWACPTRLTSRLTALAVLSAPPHRLTNETASSAGTSVPVAAVLWRCDRRHPLWCAGLDDRLPSELDMAGQYGV